MFIDEATIQCRAGNGAKGCQSFHREKNISKGRPDGGDGGNGGSVIAVCDGNIQTLLYFQFNKHFQGKNGSLGSSNNKRGKDAEDIFLRVPPGTIIRDQKHDILLRDMTEPGQQLCLCKGGRGGKGNSRFRHATEGAPGEKRTLHLELKVIAQVGLVGFPNAGKSTFIRQISSAKPRIGAYPFTTKDPILGMVKYHGDVFTVADIPGLIEGAHKGRGLGDRFLRHIERTSILVHMVDVSEMNTEEPIDCYNVIKKELRAYSNTVAEKPMIVAASKMDMPQAKDRLARFQDALGEKIYPISSHAGEGIEELIKKMHGTIYTEVKNEEE